MTRRRLFQPVTDVAASPLPATLSIPAYSVPPEIEPEFSHVF
jgi:hypothetical protein